MANTSNLSEQEIIRREKLVELQQLGIDPYPAPLYPVNITAARIKADYPAQECQDVCIAGRLMNNRDMAKASIASLQDSSGKIQIYTKRKEICPAEAKTLDD